MQRDEAGRRATLHDLIEQLAVGDAIPSEATERRLHVSR
jgi:hypothetical protein